MGDLEGQMKEILMDFIKPDRTDFSRTSLQQLRLHEPTLRRWLVKTAETLSHLVSRSGVQQIPSHFAPLARQDQIPETCLIYAAWLPTFGYNAEIGRGFRAFHNGQFSRNLESPGTFNFSIQLNHLALRIANASPSWLVNQVTGERSRLDSDWMLMQWKDPSDKSCSPCFITPRTATLEETDSPIFKNFSEFTKACVVCTGLIPPEFEESEILAAQESLSRPYLP